MYFMLLLLYNLHFMKMELNIKFVIVDLLLAYSFILVIFTFSCQYLYIVKLK